MNKRLSFLTTIVIALFAGFLIAAGGIWISNRLSLPDWVNTFINSLVLFSYFEIAGQLGPKQFDTPLTAFSTLSARDKVVVLFACIAFVVVMYPIGLSFESFWVSLIFIGIAFLSFGIICFLFGTAKLRERLHLTRKSDTMM